MAYFTPLGPACPSCATPILSHHFLPCGLCATQPNHLDRVITTYRFEEPLRTVMHTFKYREGLYLTSFLGTLMMQSLPTHYNTECLIPIPMHLKRLRYRGFNQALLLARYLARYTHFPLDTTLCKKIIDTPNQADLDAKARQRNLRHAFQVGKTSYQHVTIIDDLLTTGSTANALAYELKHAGVQRVDLWCCARTCL